MACPVVTCVFRCDVPMFTHCVRREASKAIITVIDDRNVAEMHLIDRQSQFEAIVCNF